MTTKFMVGEVDVGLDGFHDILRARLSDPADPLTVVFARIRDRLAAEAAGLPPPPVPPTRDPEPGGIEWTGPGKCPWCGRTVSVYKTSHHFVRHVTHDRPLFGGGRFPVCEGSGKEWLTPELRAAANELERRGVEMTRRVR